MEYNMIADKMLLENKKAPAFTLKDSDGNKVSLKNFNGKWLVLYFYPKDNTPGCTTEAIDFSCAADKFQKAGAAIIGISPDSEQSHQKFIAKHELGFTLLSDPEHKVIEKYGAWQLKKNYGKEYYGVVRSTFLIDPQGKIKKVWPKVKVKGHIDDVLNTLEEL